MKTSCHLNLQQTLLSPRATREVRGIREGDPLPYQRDGDGGARWGTGPHRLSRTPLHSLRLYPKQQDWRRMEGTRKQSRLDRDGRSRHRTVPPAARKHHSLTPSGRCRGSGRGRMWQLRQQHRATPSHSGHGFTRTGSRGCYSHDLPRRTTPQRRHRHRISGQFLAASDLSKKRKN